MFSIYLSIYLFLFLPLRKLSVNFLTIPKHIIAIRRILDFQGFSKTPSTKGLFYYIKLNTKIPRVPHIDPSARRGHVFESDVVWRWSRSPSANCSGKFIRNPRDLRKVRCATLFSGGPNLTRLPPLLFRRWTPTIAAVFLSGQQVDELP